MSLTFTAKQLEQYELKHIHVEVSRPTRAAPHGRTQEGHYRIVPHEGETWVIMCRPDGHPVKLDGMNFADVCSTRSGELNEREVATILTRDIAAELKKTVFARPDGFGGELLYRKDGSVY
jgi:hypothetical protein